MPPASRWVKLFGPIFSHKLIAIGVAAVVVVPGTGILMLVAYRSH
jgi:hypothetical protein